MHHTLGSVHETFGIVLFVVVGLAAVVGLISLAGRGRMYDEIGRSGLPPEAEPEPLTGDAALTQEVRALVEVRNERRRRRGEPPLDVEAEVARELRELRGG